MPVSASNKSTVKLSALQADSIQDRGTLRSRLLAGDSYLHKVSLGKKTIQHDPENNWRYQCLRKIQIALKIVLPELINDSPQRIRDLKDEFNSKMRYRLAADPYDSKHPVEPIQNLEEALITRLGNWPVADPRYDPAYDNVIEGWLYIFQVLTEMREIGGIEHAKLDAATLRRLDTELEKIQYYSTDPEKPKTIHNASKALDAGYLTNVFSKNGAKAYREPNKIDPSFETIGFNKRVLVIHILREGWCYVNLEDGSPAYVETERLAHRVRLPRTLYDQLDTSKKQDIILPAPMPDPEAQLYTIKPDEKLEHIIDKNYDVSADLDRRFYANVLLFVNNPDGKETMFVHDLDINTGTRYHNSVKAAIYVEDGDTVWSVDTFWQQIAEQSRSVSLTALKWANVENERYGGWNYEKIKYRANHTIWLPSNKYAKTLKNVVDNGSVIRGQVKDIKNAAIDFRKKEINPIVGELSKGIDEHWPDGRGIRIEGSVGATIGVPIDLDFDVGFYLWRDGENIKFSRTGVIGIRPNLEIGVGGYFGAGKGRKKAKEGEAVFGIEIGAGVYAEFKLVIAQEITFPIKDELAMASFFSLVMLEPLKMTGGPSAIVASVLHKGLSFFDIDPNDYTTKFKIQGSIKGGAEAQVRAGLQFAKGDDSPLGWTEDLDKYESGSGVITKKIAKWLSVELSAALSNEVAIGVEWEVPDAKFTVDPGTDTLIPAAFEYTLALGQNLTATASLPFIGSLLPSNFSGGLKLKMGYLYDKDVQMNVENPNTYHIGFLVGIGDLDAYVEPGYEVTVWYDPLTLYVSPPDLSRLLKADAASLIDEATKLLAMFHSVEVKLRTGLSGAKGSKFAAIKNKELQTMLKGHGKTHRGFVYTLFLDTEFKFVRSDLSDLTNSFLGQLLIEMAENALEPSKALAKVLETMIVGRPPTKKNAAVTNRFYNALREQKLTLHAELGLGIGGSIKASAGAKGRGRFYLAGRAMSHTAVKFDQIKKLLGLPLRTDMKKKLLASPLQSFNQITIH